MVLAASAAVIGVWAGFAPRAFYDSFPLPGRPWVSRLGPYDEHLVRDVGWLYLSLTTVSAWATVRPRPNNLRVVGVAWLLSGVPHLLFRLSHLEMFDVADRVGTTAALGGTVLASALLVLPARQARRPTRAVDPAPPGTPAIAVGEVR